MKHTYIKLPLTLLAGVCIAASAQAASVAVQLTGDGWATATNCLSNGNSIMTGTNIQPGSGYTGPAFRGGAVATDTTIGDWHWPLV